MSLCYGPCNQHLPCSCIQCIPTPSHTHTHTHSFTPAHTSHLYPSHTHFPSSSHKQRFCRGYIARRNFRRRLHSIIKIQSLIRMILARNRVQLMRIERRKRLEAERLRKEEEERLKKKMKQEEARKEAERLHQVGREGGGGGRGRECRRGG